MTQKSLNLSELERTYTHGGRVGKWVDARWLNCSKNLRLSMFFGLILFILTYGKVFERSHGVKNILNKTFPLFWHFLVEMFQKQFFKNKYFNKVKTLERATIRK